MEVYFMPESSIFSLLVFVFPVRDPTACDTRYEWL